MTPHARVHCESVTLVGCSVWATECHIVTTSHASGRWWVTDVLVTCLWWWWCWLYQRAVMSLVTYACRSCRTSKMQVIYEINSISKMKPVHDVHTRKTITFHSSWHDEPECMHNYKRLFVRSTVHAIALATTSSTNLNLFEWPTCSCLFFSVQCCQQLKSGSRIRWPSSTLGWPHRDLGCTCFTRLRTFIFVMRLLSAHKIWTKVIFDKYYLYRRLQV